MLAVANTWTGTRGVVSPDFSGDWEEDMEKVRSYKKLPEDPALHEKVVLRALQWARTNLGDEIVGGMTVIQMVEEYLGS